MMKKLSLGLLLLLSGCATYTLVEPDRRAVSEAFSVKPGIQWSEIKDGNAVLWTVDGAELDSIRFISGIREGVAIMDIAGEKHQTPFRPDMSETELVDAIVDAFALAGAQKVKARNLRPFQFGGSDGFRFEADFLNTEGLEKEAAVVGAVVDQSLHLIIYSGAKLHYFPKYASEFENIVNSIQMERALQVERSL